MVHFWKNKWEIEFFLKFLRVFFLYKTFQKWDRILIGAVEVWNCWAVESQELRVYNIHRESEAIYAYGVVSLYSD